jgi:hypothetical protein
MTKDEVLKLALDALEKTNRFVWYGTHSEPIGQIAEQGNTAITAIKEALAQPEQEPVSTWGVATAHQAEVQRINSELQRLKIVFKTTGETE